MKKFLILSLFFNYAVTTQAWDLGLFKRAVPTVFNYSNQFDKNKVMHGVVGLAVGYYLADPVLGALFGLDEKYAQPRFAEIFKQSVMATTALGAAYFQNSVLTGCALVAALLLHQQNKLFMTRLRDQRKWNDREQRNNDVSIISSILPISVYRFINNNHNERNSVEIQATVTTQSTATSTDNQLLQNLFLEGRVKDLQNTVDTLNQRTEQLTNQLRISRKEYNRVQQQHAQKFKEEKEIDAAKRKEQRQSWRNYANHLKKQNEQLEVENQKLKNAQPFVVDAFTIGDLNNLINSVAKTTTHSSAQTE